MNAGALKGEEYVDGRVRMGEGCVLCIIRPFRWRRASAQMRQTVVAASPGNVLNTLLIKICYTLLWSNRLSLDTKSDTCFKQIFPS